MAKKKASNPRSRPDHYALKAKKEGYPARSVYKLEEIQQKFHLIKPGDSVLDIGAAPGSWTLYTHRKLLKGNGRIVSVDLKPLALNPLPSTVTAFIGDAFSPEMTEKIAELGPYKTIISDAAPATTGNKTVDALRSQGLAESILQLVPIQLTDGGNLVIKIFQGGDGFQAIQHELRTLFQKVKTFKPQACRKDSFETFIIGVGKKRLQKLQKVDNGGQHQDGI